MVYAEINNTNDQIDLNAEIYSAPFGTPAMADKGFNEAFGLTQSKEPVAFLTSNDELLGQLSTNSYYQFSDNSYKQNTYQPAGKTTDQAPKQPTDQASKQTTDQAAKTNDQPVKQFSDASSVRPAQRFPVSEENNITYGPLEFGFDENGNVFSIRGPRDQYFYIGSDGKWVEHMPPDRERTVDNFEYDQDGNMKFDVVSNGSIVHHVRNADGSHSVESKEEYGGKLVYDKNGNLTEAPAGEGHTRKFHYDQNGQLDKIDGRLGQWERKVEDGKVVWVNNKGVRWEGEMRVNPKTNDLEFRGRNGAAWNFTTHGKDVPAYSR